MCEKAYTATYKGLGYTKAIYEAHAKCESEQRASQWKGGPSNCLTVTGVTSAQAETNHKILKTLDLGSSGTLYSVAYVSLMAIAVLLHFGA